MQNETASAAMTEHLLVPKWFSLRDFLFAIGKRILYALCPSETKNTKKGWEMKWKNG